MGLVLPGSRPGLAARQAQSPAELPSRLSGAEFWSLSTGLSEPDGTFQSDNLLSNELVFGQIVPELVSRAKPGGVYVGVGPEQNFTYIAAIRPRIAFINDIRRGNLHMQLMYKALFELSVDRAEFVSRLFTKPRQARLTSSATVTELMTAYWDVPTSSEQIYSANLRDIQQHLTGPDRFLSLRKISTESDACTARSTGTVPPLRMPPTPVSLLRREAIAASRTGI